jgi:hypothetical protein
MRLAGRSSLRGNELWLVAAVHFEQRGKTTMTKPHEETWDDEEEEAGTLTLEQQIVLARQAQAHLSREWLASEFGEHHPVLLAALQQFIERRKSERREQGTVAQGVQAAPLSKQELLRRAFQALLKSAAAYQTREQAWDVVREEEEQTRSAWKQYADYTPAQERVRQAWLKASHHFYQAKQEFTRVIDSVGLEALGVWLGSLSLSLLHRQIEPDASRLDVAEVVWVLEALLEIAETDERNTPSDDRRHLAFLKAAMDRGKKLLAEVKEMRRKDHPVQ